MSEFGDGTRYPSKCGEDSVVELAAQASGGEGQGGTTQQSVVRSLGFKESLSRDRQSQCQVKEFGLYFVGGSVSLTELMSGSILSGLNLESSAWWQLVDGLEGNKVGDGEGNQEQALVID